MRRKDREVTDRKQIEAIIDKCSVCRIAFIDDEYPYLIPVNFGYEDGSLFIHSAPQGKKIDLIKKNNRVCFEMEADVRIVEGNTPCRWSTAYSSVVGFGRASLTVDPQEKTAGLEVVFRHYTNAPFNVAAEALEGIVIIRIDIDSMTAKVSGTSIPFVDEKPCGAL